MKVKVISLPFGFFFMYVFFVSKAKESNDCLQLKGMDGVWSVTRRSIETIFEAMVLFVIVYDFKILNPV